MNLLHANDRSGQYPPSWYAASSTIPRLRASLEGSLQADICVIGGGYTGLSAALHLAQAGRKVVLLEAQRVGFGASGRNGGQLGAGQRVDQFVLEKMLGPADAYKLWDMGRAAVALVKDLVASHDIDCLLKPGLAWTAETQADVQDLFRYADHMQKNYAYPLQKLDKASCHALCPSPRYKGGLLDQEPGHLHPLRYALGLAKAAEGAGATIHEKSEVTAIDLGPKAEIRTLTGRVSADYVVLACNGYLGNLAPSIAARVMPINNYVIATAPLKKPQRVLTQDIAVADSRFVVNYFRLTHDHRLLFGGGESYGYRFPKDIAAKVRKPLIRVFPHLRDVTIDYAWGGTLAITMSRMPCLMKLAPNLLSASGYSGHGVGTATHCGQLIAQAIQGQSDGFDTMAALPSAPFPGGLSLRSPLLALAMTWYSLRDRLGI